MNNRELNTTLPFGLRVSELTKSDFLANNLLVTDSGEKTDLSENTRSKENLKFDPVPGFEGSVFVTSNTVFGTNLDVWGKYKRFVPVVKAVASMSKQNGTKVGCIVLGDGLQILSTGWNGTPRRSKAEHDYRSETRELRLIWVCHAEANAIANAARSGVSLLGGVLLCTLMPCMTCAKLIVQAGISTVLCPEPSEHETRWADEFKYAKKLFDECSVGLHYYDEKGI